VTKWHLLKLARIWSIGMKTSFGGIRLRSPDIFWRVKMTVWE
jgi:lipoprotein-anchoring transpeptidase ErfK/SrfK